MYLGGFIQVHSETADRPSQQRKRRHWHAARRRRLRQRVRRLGRRGVRAASQTTLRIPTTDITAAAANAPATANTAMTNTAAGKSQAALENAERAIPGASTLEATGGRCA